MASSLPIYFTINQILSQIGVSIGTQPTAGGGGEIDVFAFTQSNINVDTNVTVGFRWTGDLSSVIESYVVINNGYSCGSNVFYGANIGEYTSTFEITYITPSYSSTQEYLIYNMYTNIYTCP